MLAVIIVVVITTATTITILWGLIEDGHAEGTSGNTGLNRDPFWKVDLGPWDLSWLIYSTKYPRRGISV